MFLEGGLSERYWLVDIVPLICQGKILFQRGCDARIEEAVYLLWRFQNNVEAALCTC